MPGKVVSRRFVGREPELARVAAAIAAAASGTATTVVVAGGAGAGASRFLDEVGERAGRLMEPPLVLRGAAHGPVDPPWAAVLDALVPLLVTRPPDEVRALLARDARPLLLGVPGLAAFAGDAPERHDSALADPERRQPRALEALLRWLGRVAVERPIVLMLEDCHAADAATRAFATFVARIAREERLCLFLTYQPDRLTREHPMRENLATIDAGLRSPVRVDLGPLSRREVAALIEGIEGERPSASIVVLVAERSAGSPLVVEELLAARRELRNVALTGSLADLVSARLARRSPACREVLRLLATAERPLGPARFQLAATALDLDLPGPGVPQRGQRPPPLPRRARGGAVELGGPLADGLTEALEHGVAVNTPGGQFTVRHELVARAIAADLLPAQRARYHAALAGTFADIPPIAAAHWRAAHRLPEARSAGLDAARLATRLEAPQDALAWYEMALELPVPADDDEGTLEITQLAAEAAHAAMRPTRAVAFAESALATAGERRDRTTVAALEARLGRYRLAAGDASGAAAVLRRAADRVPAGASIERARILALLAQERMIAGAFGEAEPAAAEALEIARALGDAATPEAIHAKTTLAVVRAWGDAPATAVELLRDAIDRARALGLVEEWWRAVANMATVQELLGRPDDAIDETFRAMAQARAMDLDAVYGNLLAGNVAGILVEVGRWPEARELSLRALDWSPAGIPFVSAILSLVIVEIETEAGEEAGRLLGRVLVELETSGDIQFAVPAYQATASYAMWSGDLADARRAAERGWARVRGTEDWVLIARMAATALEVEAAIVAEALARRRIGDVAASRERSGRILAEVEGAVARARAAGDGDGRGEPEANLATARAFHARLQNRDDPARWAELAGRWLEVGDPYREARARWRQAEATLGAATASGGPGARGRTDARVVRVDAREPLLEAVGLGLRLSARPLLRELRELARRALIALPPEVDAMLERPAPQPAGARPTVVVGPVPDVPVPQAPSGPPSRGGGVGGDTFGLSKRELEVLALIARGKTNREIGDHLFISQKTVGVHVGNILAKLGVSGRVEAAAVAIRLGLEDAGSGPGGRMPERTSRPPRSSGPTRLPGLTRSSGPTRTPDRPGARGG
jgi:DNA-binding CsgD family transcriptional regulator